MTALPNPCPRAGKWFVPWFKRRKWRFVGMVEAKTDLVSDGVEVVGGRMRGYWNLEERDDGLRRVTLYGDPGHSASANYIKASVHAWKAGGPLPQLCKSPSPVGGGGEPVPKSISGPKVVTIDGQTVA